MLLKKSLTLSMFLISSLSATQFIADRFDQNMINAQKRIIQERISQDNRTLNDIVIKNKKFIDLNWVMYELELTIQDKKETVKVPLILFTDGRYQTTTLTDIRSGIRIEQEFIDNINARFNNNSQKNKKREEFEKNFKLNNKYYNKEHLLYGNRDAKNKIVILSDPLCIACRQVIPNILKKAKQNKDIAIYYYHYPLVGLHPTANIISAALMKAKNEKKDITDLELKWFSSKLPFNEYKLKDPKIALKAFNEIFNLNYTIEDLKPYLDKLNKEMQIGNDVQLLGTPTMLINGSLYNARQKIAKVLFND